MLEVELPVPDEHAQAEVGDHSAGHQGGQEVALAPVDGARNDVVG